MLLFIKAAMLGDMLSQDIFNFLGPMPSRPVVFPGSRFRVKLATCDDAIGRIWKEVPACITLSVEFKRNETVEKNSFNLQAIS